MTRQIRFGLTAIAALMGSACAHGGSDVGGLAWRSVDGPMCAVHVENGYDTPVEAGAIAGAQEVYLGVVDPDGKQKFGVPCSYGVVTVFRVVRAGQPSETRLGERARALDPDEVTVVTLRPSASRATGSSSHR